MYRRDEGACVSSWLTLVMLVCVTLRDSHFQKSPYPPLLWDILGILAGDTLSIQLCL